MVIHSDERPFQCDKCAERFKTSSTLSNHQVSHSEEKNEECKVCGKRFKNRRYLLKHHRLHTGAFEAYCEPCDKKFVQGYNYKMHVEKHHAVTSVKK